MKIRHEEASSLRCPLCSSDQAESALGWCGGEQCALWRPCYKVGLLETFDLPTKTSKKKFLFWEREIRVVDEATIQDPGWQRGQLQKHGIYGKPVRVQLLTWSLQEEPSVLISYEDLSAKQYGQCGLINGKE